MDLKIRASGILIEERRQHTIRQCAGMRALTRKGLHFVIGMILSVEEVKLASLFDQGHYFGKWKQQKRQRGEEGLPHKRIACYNNTTIPGSIKMTT